MSQLYLMVRASMISTLGGWPSTKSSTDGPDGEMRISAYSPAVAEEIALGEEFMDDYRDAFRALAK